MFLLLVLLLFKTLQMLSFFTTMNLSTAMFILFITFQLPNNCQVIPFKPFNYQVPFIQNFSIVELLFSETFQLLYFFSSRQNLSLVQVFFAEPFIFQVFVVKTMYFRFFDQKLSKIFALEPFNCQVYLKHNSSNSFFSQQPFLCVSLLPTLSTPMFSSHLQHEISAKHSLSTLRCFTIQASIITQKKKVQ